MPPLNRDAVSAPTGMGV